MRRFFEKYVIRQTGEQLAPWSSLNKTLYVLLPLLIYYLVSDVTEIAAWGMINGILRLVPESTLDMAYLYNETIKALVYAVTSIVSILCLKTMAKNEITYVSENEKTLNLNLAKYAALILLGISASFFFNIIANVTGFVKLSEGYDTVYENQMGVKFVFGILIYGLISPIVEETLFRGILYNRMKRLFSVRIAMLASSLIFGLFHMNLVQGLYGFIMGLIIVWVYEKSGNFITAVIIHTAANVAVYAVTYRTLIGDRNKLLLYIIALVMLAIAAAEMLYINKTFKADCEKEEKN